MLSTNELPGETWKHNSKAYILGFFCCFFNFVLLTVKKLFGLWSKKKKWNLLTICTMQNRNRGIQLNSVQ